MNEIPSVRNYIFHPASSASQSSPARARADEGTALSAPPDRAELTNVTDGEPVQPELPPEINGRLAEIRARIARGTYLTPDKIEQVVDRLYDAVVPQQ